MSKENIIALNQYLERYEDEKFSVEKITNKVMSYCKAQSHTRPDYNELLAELSKIDINLLHLIFYAAYEEGYNDF